MSLPAIISESSVAAGVRRIEAVTGLGVIRLIEDNDKLIGDTAKALKANNTADMPQRAVSLQNEISAQKKEIDELNRKIAGMKLETLISDAKAVKSVRLIVSDLGNSGLDSARALCQLAARAPTW